MADRHLKWYRRDENGIVVEPISEHSLFKPQYDCAWQILKRIEDVQALTEGDNVLINNIIAFSGDRGTGKTSCMYSFNRSLPASCLRLDMIDPSFFENDLNIIDLFLGSLYRALHLDTEASQDYDCRKIKRCFSKAKRCLKDLTKSKNEMYDALEDIHVIDASMQLRKRLVELIDAGIAFYNANLKDKAAPTVTRVVVMIDDLDTKATGIYAMSEQIRKYLSLRNCMVLMSVNTEQLRQLLAYEMCQVAQPSADERRWYADMADKYVVKFLPNNQQVAMPGFMQYSQLSVDIDKGAGANAETFSFESLKDGVLQLIYLKTRYLFYNTIGETSTIVPKNLRKVRQLIALLLSMDDFDSNEKNLSNKTIFKSYFFEQWKEQCDSQDLAFVKKLHELEDLQTINKVVVRHLANKFNNSMLSAEASHVGVHPGVGSASSLIDSEEFERRQANEPTNYLPFITSNESYTYNVSVGDVFYAIELLRRLSSDNQGLLLLIYYLRSYYSMLLYEQYDVISEIGGKLYPKSNALSQTIKRDAWFDKSNALQRLVNGAYFTFAPKSILPSGEDYCLRSTGFIYSLVEKIKDNPGVWDDKYQFLELAMLCTESVLPDGSFVTIGEYQQAKRKEIQPVYSLPIKEEGQIALNILAIFTNICNLKECYRRFFIDDSFYELAKHSEGSLLYKMGLASYNLRRREKIEDDTDRDAFTRALLSTAVLRNAEVISNIFDKAVRLGHQTLHSDSFTTALANIYKGLVNTDMQTYNIGQKNPYEIKFDFLLPIVDLLDRPDARDEWNDLFFPSFGIPAY